MLAFESIDPEEQLIRKFEKVVLSDKDSLSISVTRSQAAGQYINEPLKLNISTDPPEEISALQEECAGLYRRYKRSKESEIVHDAHIFVEKILKLVAYPLFLVDKADAGLAGQSINGPVTDAFVFPAKPSWDAQTVDRNYWWARAAFLVEYKKPSLSLDDEECLGQCIQYAQELLRACPTRQHGMVVLFNLKSVRVVLVSRQSSSGTRVQSTSVQLTSTIGLDDFYSAARMARSSSTFPWSLAKKMDAPVSAKLNDIKRKDFCFVASIAPQMSILGSGTTACVLQWNGKCIKIFKSTRDKRFDEFENECRALQTVSKVRESLPEGPAKRALPNLVYAVNDGIVGRAQMVSFAENTLVIITTPLGTPLVDPNVGDLPFSSFAPAIEALKLVHAQDVFHRDLGLNNWITLANGELVIIDWGFSTTSKARQSGEYVGSVWFASDSALDGLDNDWVPKVGDVPPTAAMDLESVVKMIASLCAPGVRTFIKTRREGLGHLPTPTYVLQTWEKIWADEEAEFILPLRDAARDGNYEGMVDILAELGQARKKWWSKEE